MELLNYEWRRARSIRTTWITSFFLIASVAGFAYLTTLATGDPEVDALPLTDIIGQSIAVNPIALVLLASLGAMAFGHEYRYGTIRLTLTAFPRRTGVFLAKLVMTVLLTLGVLAVAAAVAYGVLVLVQADTGGGLSWTDLAWQTAVFGMTLSGLAFCLTVITRNHPLGIIGPLLLSILESVLIAILGERFRWLPEVLPLTSMQSWFYGEDVARSVAVWSAWMLGLLVFGFVLLKRRDA